MRISDWSSDVCSSDLGLAHGAGEALDALLDAGFQLGHRLELARAPQFRQYQANHVQAGIRCAGELIWPSCCLPIRPTCRNTSAGSTMPLCRARAGACADRWRCGCTGPARSEEHTSELQSLMRTSYAVFCLKKKKQKQTA